MAELYNRLYIEDCEEDERISNDKEYNQIEKQPFSQVKQLGVSFFITVLFIIGIIIIAIQSWKSTLSERSKPIIPKVTESVVKGLEQPLEFTADTLHQFTIIGAGTNSYEPVRGDVKWVPLYWSMHSDPLPNQIHNAWKIGVSNTIYDEGIYNRYIFFMTTNMMELNGKEWNGKIQRLLNLHVINSFPKQFKKNFLYLKR